MENNCLVTKLKTTINDNSFPKFNSIRINFFGGEFIDGNNVILVELLKDVEYISTHNISVYNASSVLITTNSTGTLVVGNKYYIKFPGVDGHVDFINKYNSFKFISKCKDSLLFGNIDMTKPFGYSIDISQLAYTNVPIMAPAATLSGEFNPPENSQKVFWSIDNMKIYSQPNVKVNIEKFASVTEDNPSYLQDASSILSLYFIGAYGDIRSLGNCSKMISLSVSGTQCTGEITELLDSLKSKGSTRNIFINAYQCPVTYYGTVLTNARIKELNNGGDEDRLKFHIENNTWTQVPF